MEESPFFYPFLIFTFHCMESISGNNGKCFFLMKNDNDSEKGKRERTKAAAGEEKVMKIMNER